jgi:hypothetical protein
MARRTAGAHFTFRATIGARISMQLVLTLPGLLAREPPNTSRAPHLARLLALSGEPLRQNDGLDAALAARYGIERGADWPLASIRVDALGVDPESAYWLAADPVTLVAGRDDVRLIGPVRDLSASDAAALVATLNAHFARDGIAFVTPRPDAWFARAPAPVALVTRPLATVTGRSLRALLPAGRDAGTWRRWQDEIQMLFHEHPVNVARERAGKAPANSVWFADGGTLPARPTGTQMFDTWANGGIATALAAHRGMPAHALPDALDPTLAVAGEGAVIVVVLDAPLDLDPVERVWAMPAWKALARGTLDAVTLLADGDGDAAAWTASRPGFVQRLRLGFATQDLAALVGAARIPS